MVFVLHRVAQCQDTMKVLSRNRGRQAYSAEGVFQDRFKTHKLQGSNLLKNYLKKFLLTKLVLLYVSYYGASNGIRTRAVCSASRSTSLYTIPAYRSGSRPDP